MDFENTPDHDESMLGLVTRRNAMKAGAGLAGALALGGTATGAAQARESVGAAQSSPTDMFLELEGIEGESTDPAHEGDIDVLAWSWGARNSATVHSPRGGGSGASEIGDITITKSTDSSTPPLFQHVATGRHIPRGTFVIRRQGGDESVNFLEIDLETILVNEVHIDGVINNRQIETVSLNFARFIMTYTPQDSDGTPLPDVSFGFDIRRNEEI